MEVFQAFFGDESFQSTSAGAAQASTWSGVTGAALRSKELLPYLWLKEVSANTRVKVFFSHSPDGRRWVDESDAILDTGASADAAALRLMSPDDSVVSKGAFHRFRVTVEERS